MMISCPRLKDRGKQSGSGQTEREREGTRSLQTAIRPSVPWLGARRVCQPHRRLRRSSKTHCARSDEAGSTQVQDSSGFLPEQVRWGWGEKSAVGGIISLDSAQFSTVSLFHRWPFPVSEADAMSRKLSSLKSTLY